MHGTDSETPAPGTVDLGSEADRRRIARDISVERGTYMHSWDDANGQDVILTITIHGTVEETLEDFVRIVNTIGAEGLKALIPVDWTKGLAR